MTPDRALLLFPLTAFANVCVHHQRADCYCLNELPGATWENLFQGDDRLVLRSDADGESSRNARLVGLFSYTCIILLLEYVVIRFAIFPVEGKVACLY